MAKSIAQKITLLNKVTLDSLGEGHKLAVVKKFTEASIKIMAADFGFAWWRRHLDQEYELVYKSKALPYEPSSPRLRGGNYLAQKSGKPVFIEDTSKETYTPQTDVRAHMKSYAIIPIVYNHNFYGNVIVAYKSKKKFSDEERSLAEAVGNSMAQALTISRLHNNLQNFQKTLDNTLDGIFIFSSQSFKLKYANNGAVDFTGFTRKQLLKKTIFDAVSGLLQSEMITYMAEIMEHPKTNHCIFESTMHHCERGKVPVEVYLQHVNNEDRADQFLIIVRDITERKAVEKSMAKMAYYDQLTGIPNRAFLTERLKEEHEREVVNKGMYAMFFIDLDRFKIINDIYGHPVGDDLLRQVAQRMRKILPKKSTLARMGGDEFIVLLPQLSAIDEAEKCATKILEIFTDFFRIADQEIYCNGSIGFAVFPLDGVDYHVVMKHADLALHRAKERGGSNYQQYRQGQPSFYTMQPKLQSQLRHALQRNELVLHYQPVINVRSKKIIGLEALVRWNHPDLGLLYPKDFVGQAEESGLIIEIGEWVINEACRQVREWEAEGKIPPPVSINVSPRELLRPTLVKSIDKALKKYKISPSQIKLELTETFLMKNIDLSISILEQLKALGLRILIDDFGTGYASLNYLKRLPIDAVKIDRTFVAGIPASLQDSALTSAIIAISHQLGLEVIAEGVENIDQFEFLRAAQCNFAQGNFFFTPVNAQQVSDLLHLSRG